MRKVLVIGSGGAGKTTFAMRLSNILNIEVIHLDALYWNPGWVETPKVEWRRTVEGLIARGSWIIDGNYSGTLDMRIGACDTVIFLDIARRICLWRVIKRVMQYRNRRRPDMAEGCQERLDLKFVRWVWNYKKRTRPKIVKLIEENADGKKVVWLQSDGEVERFLVRARRAYRRSTHSDMQ
ncbi:MAG: DNA topology modulation protein [Acidobacteria bacterium]|nr:DNA topology modulation protein [Acidobacteriota bacterium]